MSTSRDDREQARKITALYTAKYGEGWVRRNEGLATLRLQHYLADSAVVDVIRKVARALLQRNSLSGTELSQFMVVLR